MQIDPVFNSNTAATFILMSYCTVWILIAIQAKVFGIVDLCNIVRRFIVARFVTALIIFLLFIIYLFFSIAIIPNIVAI